MAKPIPEHQYLKYIRLLDWDLRKGGIDYNLYDENNHFLCSIKIAHGKGKKREVVPGCIRKTQKICEERGLKWPPRKK
jgi:hypothetical protein